MPEFNDGSIKLLLVDDYEDDYWLTLETLAEIECWKVNLEWVATYEAAMEVIAVNDYDACLIDYRLGQQTGLELIREALKDGCDAPLILLTGQGDRDVDLEAMKIGASDYLVKSCIESSLLERSIRYSIQRKLAEESRSALEAQLLQSQKLESIAQLAGGVAHEFNNLLTPIIGYTHQMISQVPPESDWGTKLEAIDKAATRASNLVSQLLSFAHSQTGNPSLFDLNDLIIDVSRMLRPLINENI